MKHFLLCLLLASSAFAQETPEPSDSAAPKSKKVQPADQPFNKNVERFNNLHASFLQRGKAGPIGVLFLGDSITEYWGKVAPDVWKESFGKYQPANFGISGDRTQYVIWRIDNGELDGIDPKVVVLMIGTNNLMTNSAAEITTAIKAIVSRIQTKLPQTKILLLGIFPRGPRLKPESDPTAAEFNVAAKAKAEGKMKDIHAINAELAKMDNGTSLRYLDLEPKFLDADGKIPADVMPDQLHPGLAGYQIWAKNMQPLLDEMMAGSKNP